MDTSWAICGLIMPSAESDTDPVASKAHVGASRRLPYPDLGRMAVATR